MSFIDTVISKIAPYDCLECGKEGELLCGGCINKLITVQEFCYRCHQFSKGSLTCPECYKAAQLGKVQAATAYSGSAKDLVWKLKSSGAQAAAQVMAVRMASLLPTDKRLLVVGVPTATV